MPVHETSIADAMIPALRAGQFNSWFPWQALVPRMTPALTAKPSPPIAVQSPTVHIRASGSPSTLPANTSVPVGNTGVSVRISDLALASNDTSMTLSGRRYTTDAFLPRGSAEITGSSAADTINVFQDAGGNTVIEAIAAGQRGRVVLGNIGEIRISANGGNDTISVRGKNYSGGVSIDAGDGDDAVTAAVDTSMNRGVTVAAGNGDDTVTITGQRGNVTVDAGDGDDKVDISSLVVERETTRRLYGGNGNDVLAGSSGDDTIYGGEGADTVYGGNGRDWISGDGGEDQLIGGNGDDTLNGGTGADILIGDAGSDILNGDADPDILMGGSGGDWLNGGTGNDTLYGGSSNDEITRVLATGVRERSGLYNMLTGGPGSDTFYPLSVGPGKEVPYSGAGAILADYDPLVDLLV